MTYIRIRNLGFAEPAYGQAVRTVDIFTGENHINVLIINPAYFADTGEVNGLAAAKQCGDYEDQ